LGSSGGSGDSDGGVGMVGTGVVAGAVDFDALPDPQVLNAGEDPEELVTVAHPVATAARTPIAMRSRFITYIFAAGAGNDPSLQRTFSNFVPRTGLAQTGGATPVGSEPGTRGRL